MNGLWFWIKTVSKALISKGLAKDNSGSDWAISIPVILLRNGTVRLARGLTSRMYTS